MRLKTAWTTALKDGNDVLEASVWLAPFKFSTDLMSSRVFDLKWKTELSLKWTG